MRILWHGRRVRPGREHRKSASTGSARTAGMGAATGLARTAARALRQAWRERRQGRFDKLSANGGKSASTSSARTVAWALRQVQREWKGRERGSVPPTAKVPSFPRKRESIFSVSACPVPRYGAGIHLYDIRTGPERRAGDKPPRYQDGGYLSERSGRERGNSGRWTAKSSVIPANAGIHLLGKCMPRTPIRGGNPSLRYPHRPRTPLQRH